MSLASALICLGHEFDDTKANTHSLFATLNATLDAHAAYRISGLSARRWLVGY